MPLITFLTTQSGALCAFGAASASPLRICLSAPRRIYNAVSHLCNKFMQRGSMSPMHVTAVTLHTLFALAVMLACPIGTNAQTPTLRNFTFDEYDAGTQNWAVDIVADGTVAFANNHGMLTYDGDRWAVLRIPNYSYLRSLLCDNRRHLVFVGGTNEFGYFHVDSTDYRMHYTSLLERLPQAERTFGEVWHIAQLGETFAFQTRDRVMLMGPDGSFRICRFDNEVYGIWEAAGSLYAATQTSVAILRNGTFHPLPDSGPVAARSVVSVLPYGASVAIVTSDGGVFAYQGATLAEILPDLSPTLRRDRVYCAATNARLMAFGTVRGGLVLRDMRSGATVRSSTRNGLQNNTVLSMRFDRDNNLWLGLDNGIAYATLNSPYAKLLGMNSHIGTGYASYVDGKRLLLGTNQGLFETSAPDPAGTEPTPVAGIEGQIWSITGIGGTVLVGSNDGAYTLRGNTVKKLDGASGTWGFIPLRGTDKVLACDYRGLLVLTPTPTGFTPANRIEGFDLTSNLFMQDDIDGSIWVSHWQTGIYRLELDPALKRVERTDRYGHDNGLPMDGNNLICKIDGRVYVSAVDGFSQYDPATHGIKRCQWLTKVFDTYGTALRIVETSSGDLLASKPGYLAIGRRGANGRYTVTIPGHRNIIDHLQMGLGEPGQLDAAHLLLNANNGYYVVDLEGALPAETNATTQLMIRSVTSTSVAGDSVLYAPALATGIRTAIKVPKRLNSLNLQFVWPEFRAPGAIEYTCMLEGYDSEWGAPQHSTTKEYTKLPSGKYRFHVKASNLINGLQQQATIDIEVLPAWYETIWAKCVYILLVIGAIVLLTMLLKRNAEREVRRLKVEQERHLEQERLQHKIDEETQQKELIKMQNEHLELSLKHKSSELADNALNLVRKNDLLQSIDAEMEELHRCVNGEMGRAEVSKKIADVRRSIRSNMADDSNWDKFVDNFNLVYDNFTSKLVARYTDLKKVDIKLCMYLRMGLSSKEIASLLNTGVHSIETARYRLRKKLALEPGTNLIDFIQKI